MPSTIHVETTLGMEYTYVLLSERDGPLYTGSSGNVRARFGDHNAGRVHFVKTGKGKRYLANRLKQSLQVLREIKLERH